MTLDAARSGSSREGIPATRSSAMSKSLVIPHLAHEDRPVVELDDKGPSSYGVVVLSFSSVAPQAFWLYLAVQPPQGECPSEVVEYPYPVDEDQSRREPFVSAERKEQGCHGNQEYAYAQEPDECAFQAEEPIVP
jgi:hypothetical protein